MSERSAALGRVQLEVDDLERSAAFYSRFLGLRVTERMESRKGRMVLLSGGDRHREVTLRAAPEGGDEATDGDDADGGTRGGGTAFSAPLQVGFEMSGRGALADLFFELRKERIPTTAVDHGVCWAVYFRDPDGHALEAYWDTREEDEGRRRWGGRSQLLAVSQVLSEERVRELEEHLEEEPGDGDEEDVEDEEPSAGGAAPDEGGDGDAGAPSGRDPAEGPAGASD